MKYFLVLLILMGGTNLLAQSRMFVITDQLNVRAKPDTQAPILTFLALGDSVMVLDFTENKTTASINGLQVTSVWAKIEFQQSKTGWVFYGGLCEQMINPIYWEQAIVEEDSLKARNDIRKLLRDSTLIVGGNFIKFKTKIGKEIFVRECACMSETTSCKDGYRIYSLRIHSQLSHIVEIEMSVVAFTIKVYVDLKNGIKFNFPDSQACMLSEISPNTQYVIGLNMYSEKKQLLLYDFTGGKLLKQAFVDSFGEITHLKWLNDQEVELQNFNYETNQITKKRVLMIPSMQWKK